MRPSREPGEGLAEESGTVGASDDAVVASLARGAVAKREALEFSIRLMLTDRYGLDGRARAVDLYGDVDRFEYLVARQGGRIVGDFRVEPDVDLGRYDNLAPALVRHLETARPSVADLGGHIDRPDRERLAVYEVLWPELVRLARRRGIDLFYAQIRPFLLPRFQSLGFRACTAPFRVEGWTHHWRAISLRMDEAPARWGDPAFRRAWREEQGVDLDTSFFARTAGR
ncbi:MAG: hypothetical protein ACF8XB_10255 [Planctomycetota bacterium JB042]